MKKYESGKEKEKVKKKTEEKKNQGGKEVAKVW